MRAGQLPPECTPPLELFFPFSTSDPQLTEDEMARLIHVADQHEISRLERMTVLQPPLEGVEYSKLSTRFVRSFRPKPHPVTKAPSLLFRSRLVAREYKRCDPFREDLYSPASQAILNRVLPALRQSYGADGAILLSADIADAYLTVPQDKPTIVTLGYGVSYALGYMLPGQRAGSKGWFNAFTTFLVDKAGAELWRGCEALYRLKPRDGEHDPVPNAGMLHVDDTLASGSRNRLESVLDVIKSKYKVSAEMMIQEGDEISFLKRKHVLSRDGVLIIRRSTKHLSKLLDMLGLQNAAIKRTPLPSWSNEDLRDDGECLSLADQATFRSAVGVLMYMSQDCGDLQFAIRLLCQHMSSPSKRAFDLLRHVARYAKGTAGYAPSMSPTSPGVGIRARAANEGSSLVETMSDSDWGASKASRRSVSGCVCLIDSNVVASSSRTQKSISLSSCEAELLALTAACAEGIFLREAVSFCTQRPAELIVYTDSASARQFLARQGLGRLRHLDLRLLWLQDLVRSHQLRLSAVPGPENLADLQTKALKADRIRYLLHGFKVRDEANSDELVGVAEATANEDRFAISAAVRAVRSRSEVPLPS